RSRGSRRAVGSRRDHGRRRPRARRRRLGGRAAGARAPAARGEPRRRRRRAALRGARRAPVLAGGARAGAGAPGHRRAHRRRAGRLHRRAPRYALRPPARAQGGAGPRGSRHGRARARAPAARAGRRGGHGRASGDAAPGGLRRRRGRLRAGDPRRRDGARRLTARAPRAARLAARLPAGARRARRHARRAALRADRQPDRHPWPGGRPLLAGAAVALRRLGAVVEPDRPRLVAPDFAFTVGPTPRRALCDYRGARIVLVVLYTLPAARPRLAELAARYELLVPLGVEVIAVPEDAAADAIKRLGAEPRVFFPVVTDGAAEIVTTYSLLTPGPHVEFLVDRQGYLRAVEAAPRGTERLLQNVQTLNEEQVSVAPPAEHVH